MAQITNPDAKIFMALKSHMDTWLETPVHYSPSVPVNPAQESPYVIIDDARLETPTRYVGGDDVDEYRGVWNISVMVPMKWTAAQSIGLAGRLADHWPKSSWHVYSDARVQVMTRPKVIGSGYQDAGMIRFPVQVIWRAVG